MYVAPALMKSHVQQFALTWLIIDWGRKSHNQIEIVDFKSGPTSQVASSAAHMSVRASKLRDVKDKRILVWVRVFGFFKLAPRPYYVCLARR